MVRIWSVTAIAVLIALTLSSCKHNSPTASPPALASPSASQNSTVSEPPAQSEAPTALPPETVGAGSPPGRTTSPPSSDASVDKQLGAFAADCDRRIGTFASGQVDYPRTLRASMGKTVTYGAAVDIRADPAPPAKVIQASDPATEQITVQCVVGARLIAVGGDVDVKVAAGEVDDGDWRYQQFTPSGVLEWAWMITSNAPSDQQVQLELKPAVKGQGVLDVAATATATYVTTIHVDASAIQRVWYWFQTDWKLLGAILLALGAAVIAWIKFSIDVRELINKMFGRRRTPTQSQPATRRRVSAAAPRSSGESRASKKPAKQTSKRTTDANSRLKGNGPRQRER